MKMKIGDLEMEQGKGIRFHADVEHEVALPNKNLAIIEGLEALPLAKHLNIFLPILAVGAFVLALICAGIALFAGSWIAAVPIPGLFGISLVAGLFARKMRTRSFQGRAGLAGDASVLAMRARRVLELLEKRSGPLGVEEIQKELGWTEEAVITTLHAMVHQEQVVEDLDLKTGHWNYHVGEESWLLGVEQRKTLSVADRVQALAAESPVEVAEELRK